MALRAGMDRPNSSFACFPFPYTSPDRVPSEVARQPGPAHIKKKEVPSPARQVFKQMQNAELVTYKYPQGDGNR